MTFFLRTKLLPPRPAPALLPRPRLAERLLANLKRPVTLVTANAGSGKTTMVADFVRAHVGNYVWYQLDHTDADPFVFLGYLTHGIRQVIPDYGDATLAYLQQSATELGQHPERAVDVLLNEVLDRVDQQVVLILDDYHHLGAETPVHTIVDRLLGYLPDVMHAIIISREVPPLGLARLRAQGQLAIVDRNELLFTDEETQALFRLVFDLELTPAQLIEYRERTEGWITALQLVRQVAQRRLQSNGVHSRALPDLTEILRQSERDIFDYFAEEVFGDEEESERRLLLHLSLLDRIELETCARLYPEAGSASILPRLVRRNVFITVASDAHGEEYRLHPLFQSFLRRRLRAEVGRAGVASEHARIAGFFLDRGEWDQAMPHLRAAEDFDRAAAVIAEQGRTWIASGALASLASFADSVPGEILEKHPRALAYRAEVMRLRGDYDPAQAMLNRAAALLNEQGDGEGEAEALHSLATIARRRSDFAKAFAYLDRATELTGSHSPVRIKCGNTRGLCLVALGKWTGAEREFRAALQSAEEQNDEHHARLILHNLGLPAMIRGDFDEALRWLRRMLRDDRQAPPIPQEATAHLNLARCYLYRGELAACEQHLERALERCQLFNLIVARAEAFETYGDLYRERSDIERAAESYERSARAYNEAGIDLERRELLEAQALLKLETGDAGGAFGLLDRLINARRAFNDEMGTFTATLAMSRVRLERREYDVAQAELEKALAFFHERACYYYEAQASIELAACDLEAG
jgi:LuxR family maltose regulon positive regulatory protein